MPYIKSDTCKSSRRHHKTWLRIELSFINIQVATTTLRIKYVYIVKCWTWIRKLNQYVTCTWLRHVLKRLTLLDTTVSEIRQTVWKSTRMVKLLNCGTYVNDVITLYIALFVKRGIQYNSYSATVSSSICCASETPLRAVLCCLASTTRTILCEDLTYWEHNV